MFISTCGCPQARPLLGLLLVPCVAGNTVAALLLTTAGLALSTSPPVAARKPRVPPPAPLPGRSSVGAPATVTTVVSPSTNGAGPKVVVRRTGAGGSSSSNGNGVAVADQEEASILSVDPNGSNGSGVLLPGNGLEPFKQPGRVTLRTASPGRPRARLQGGPLGSLGRGTLRAQRHADGLRGCRRQGGLRRCAGLTCRQVAAQLPGSVTGCSRRVL